MKKLPVILLLLLIAVAFTKSFGQQITDTTSVDYLLSKGKEFFIKNDPVRSNDYYNKVLHQKPGHYDALFAIAANNYRLKKYQEALDLYTTLYARTPDNIEVINGMARCYMRLERYDEAKEFLNQSLALNNTDVSVWSDLAFVYSVINKLDSAIVAYRKIIQIAPENVNAQAGAGKMYYWKDKPATALKFYKKALALEPGNKEIKKYHDQIKNEMAFVLSADLKYVTEQEESYKIDAIIQKYGLQKRINNYLDLSLYTLWDYSSRNNFRWDDVYRWYDNTWLKATFILPSHRISIFGGASGNDSRITSYGISWASAWHIKNVKFRNYLTAAYDYYYYWNQVGQDYYQNTLKINYKRLNFSGTYRYAVVRNNFIFNDNGEEILKNNVNTRYHLELKYDFLKNPKISLGANVFNMDYQYKAPLYYSPQNRTILGGVLSIYYKYKKFYTYGEYNYGYDLDNVPQMSGSAEAGFDLGKSSYSLNGGFFNNKFYQSTNLQFSFKYLF